MTSTVASGPDRQLHPSSEDGDPKFIVRLAREKDDDFGVVEIRARRSYRTHDDINRWLQACLRDVAIKLEEMEGSDDA